MFEKLKEYGLYIVLGLVALGSLGSIYLNTISTKKNSEFVKEIKDSFILALSKPTKIMNGTTIADHLSIFNNYKIGKYLIQVNDELPIVLNNVSGDYLFINQDLEHHEFQFEDVSKTSGIGKLQIYLVPNNVIGNPEEKIGSTKIKNAKISLRNGSFQIGNETQIKASDDYYTFKGFHEQLRGYLATGYIGFGTFETEKEATEFRNSYFNTLGMIIKQNNSKYGVFIELSK